MSTDESSTINPRVSSDGSPFHAQFEDIGQPQFAYSNNASPYAQPFDMSSMVGALPQSPQHLPSNQPGQYGRTDGAGMHGSTYQYQQPPQHFAGRPMHFDPQAMARYQQHHHQQQQHHHHHQQQQQYISQQQYLQQTANAQRSPINSHFGPIDPYAYNMNAMSIPQFDPRFAAQQHSYNQPAAFSGDMSYLRRPTESAPAPVPSYPRGPPRKPKQSGHALWVGNLPPAANVTDLKDHFSRDATKDIESLFLISKSNCAFVNYRSEAACAAAVTRFHDSRFHGVRLVCRLRRGSTLSSDAPAVSSTGTATGITSASPPKTDGQAIPTPPTAPASMPIIVGSPIAQTTSATLKASTNASASSSGVDGLPDGQRAAERFFIVKSLTTQDLEASVRNGVWATQAHNEATLNQAYDESSTVYLIFSANKSGEYFGYARMASRIEGEAVNLGLIFGRGDRSAGGNSALSGDSATDVTGLSGDMVGTGAEPSSRGSLPTSIPTPATEFAPKGRIIDDSARGTIFWEADQEEATTTEAEALVDGEAASRETSPEKSLHDNNNDNNGTETAAEHSGFPGGDGQNWGRQFEIEWLSTTRLPFYRTRGLRNPWNANREVKIARDGTELEPGIGKRLVGMFSAPSPTRPQHQQPQYQHYQQQGQGGGLPRQYRAGYQ